MKVKNGFHFFCSGCCIFLSSFKSFGLYRMMLFPDFRIRKVVTEMSVRKNISIRAIFSWVSKEILDCTDCFFLLRSVIGPENSHLSLNQSDAKVKLIMAWSLAFSRALTICLFSLWVLYWLSFFRLIGCCDNFAFCFTTLNWKSLFQLNEFNKKQDYAITCYTELTLHEINVDKRELSDLKLETWRHCNKTPSMINSPS